MILLFLALLSGIVLPFVREFGNLLVSLLENIPYYIDSVSQFFSDLNIPLISFDSEVVKLSLLNYLESWSKDAIPTMIQGYESFLTAVNTIGVVASLIISLISALVISIYLTIDHDYLLNTFLKRFVGEKSKERVKRLVYDVEAKLGSWILGESLLMLIIGFMVWVVLTIMKVPFALPLAFFAGLMEIVPGVGPVIALGPALFFAIISGGPVKALLVLVVYMIIQQIENNIIIPNIMSNATGIRPVFLLVGILFGYSLAGVWGALFAAPILVIIKLGLEFYFEYQRLKAKGEL